MQINLGNNNNNNSIDVFMQINPGNNNINIDIYMQIKLGHGYVGCFVDTSSGQVRDLPDDLREDAQMSVELCVSHCRSGNRAYAGVQDSRHCVCGDSYGSEYMY